MWFTFWKMHWKFCLWPKFHYSQMSFQYRLRWFGHVQRRPLEAPVRSGILSQDSNVKRCRGRPKLTWVEAIKGNLKGWNIPKDLALDRNAWKTAIHVPEPWLFLLGFNSSLPQLVWDLKALLLYVYITSDTAVYRKKREYCQFQNVTGNASLFHSK